MTGCSTGPRPKGAAAGAGYAVGELLAGVTRIDGSAANQSNSEKHEAWGVL